MYSIRHLLHCLIGNSQQCYLQHNILKSPNCLMKSPMQIYCSRLKCQCRVYTHIHTDTHPYRHTSIKTHIHTDIHLYRHTHPCKHTILELCQLIQNYSPLNIQHLSIETMNTIAKIKNLISKTGNTTEPSKNNIV